MAALSNAKHERFATALAAGATVDECAESAGITLEPFSSPTTFYVYLLVDPRSRRVFYVGKGKGNRALVHEKDARAGRGNARRNLIIGELRRARLRPAIYVLAEGLSNDQAYRVERLLIVRAHKTLSNIALGAIGPLDKVAAECRDNLTHIKPLCQVWRETPEPGQMKLWARIVTTMVDIMSDCETSAERTA